MKRKAVIENINVAIKSVRAQLLRTTLTVLIIAIGITALISIITATTALEKKISSEFTSLGTNTFIIKANNTRGRRRGQVNKKYTDISYSEAKEFKREYPREDLVSITAMAKFGATVKHLSELTNPNVMVNGVDENYLELSGYSIESGRNFSRTEISLGNNVVVMGSDIVKKLFTNPETAVGSHISIDSRKFTVIGILASKGNTLNLSGDNQCLIPVSVTRKSYETKSTEYRTNVMVTDPRELDDAIQVAMGNMKLIRRDGISEESFQINKADSTANMVIENLSNVTVAATVLGFITLLGAGIGLMNIMLVSVTERTKEIGVRKAIGASASLIKQQFLIEAIIIGQIGGIVGIVFGVLFGNITALFLSTGFTVPWMWLFIGVALCFVVSLVSGYYPAKKASELDPIDALRYE
ncbi:MAG: putative ABC transport system permease protein [Flavobacteriales bacterium]